MTPALLRMVCIFVYDRKQPFPGLPFSTRQLFACMCVFVCEDENRVLEMNSWFLVTVVTGCLADGRFSLLVLQLTKP
jgi:hypothetical protein